MERQDNRSIEGYKNREMRRKFDRQRDRHKEEKEKGRK